MHFENLNFVIVEDETKSYELLSSILKEYCPGLKQLGWGRNKEEATKVLSLPNVNIAFLDIKLKDCLSFDILNELHQRTYSIIFTTAYEEFAIKAFKVEAIDYLLKPYSPTDVINAVNKVKKFQLTNQINLQVLLKDLQNKSDERISISTDEGISLILKKDIVHCEAEGAYSTIFLIDGSKIFVSKSLSELERELDSNKFIRVHSGHLVFLPHIKKYVKEDGGYLLMENGRKVPISRRKKQDVINLIR